MAYGESVAPQEALFSESRVLKLGHFAELGGELEFYGNWVPGHDPYDAATRIMNVAGYLHLTMVPLEAARQIAIKDTQDHFDSESDPEGNQWEELTANYRSYKVDTQGYPDHILIREGLLEQRATSQDAWLIIGEVLVFDAFVLPKSPQGFEYGVATQTGRKGHVVASVDQFEAFTTGEMPPRPFIGLSDEAMAEITAEFETWFDGLTYAFNAEGELPVIGSLASGQPRVSTGQFARKA